MPSDAASALGIGDGSRFAVIIGLQMALFHGCRLLGDMLSHTVKFSPNGSGSIGINRVRRNFEVRTDKEGATFRSETTLLT